VHFVTPPFEKEGGRRYQVPYPSGFVATDGGAWWPKFGAEGVTVADLERTSEAGLLQADPHALLVEVMQGGEGDFITDSWQELFHILKMLKDTASAVVVVSGAVTALTQIAEALGRKWEARGGSPRRVLEMTLRRRAWDPDELADRLLMSNDEARRWLEALGYDLTAGEYRQSTDSDKRLIRRQIRQKFLHHDPTLSDLHGFIELQRRLREDHALRSPRADLDE
jgi:hypothetical protein